MTFHGNKVLVSSVASLVHRKIMIHVPEGPPIGGCGYVFLSPPLFSPSLLSNSLQMVCEITEVSLAAVSLLQESWNL